MSWEQAVGLEWQVWRSGAQEGRGTKSRLQSNCQRDPWATDSPDKQCRRHWETKAGSDSQLPGPCTAQPRDHHSHSPLGLCTKTSPRLLPENCQVGNLRPSPNVIRRHQSSKMEKPLD